MATITDSPASNSPTGASQGAPSSAGGIPSGRSAPNGNLSTATLSKLPCCPDLETGPSCDVIDLRYAFQSRVVVNDRVVPVTLIFHYRLERCSEGLALGDLAYTTTLLPGEQVRLFSSNRHTRWSYDSATSQSYRHETTSEESYLTWGIARAATSLSVAESGSGQSSYEESWAEGGGGASVSLFGLIEIGGGGGGGSYDSNSAYAFNRTLSQHTSAASSQVAAGVRAASSTSVGEVQVRNHAEGESQERIESSSRTFSNPNKCHAITYLFYRLMKKQRIRFRLVAIQRLVNDPRAPGIADLRPDTRPKTGVSVRPQRVLATQHDRLEIERMARTAAAEELRADAEFQRADNATRFASQASPIEPDLREAAMKESLRDLAAVGLVDRETGEPTDRIVAELSWEREELLPTPGLIVKGCIDECNTCEPALKRSIELDLQRKELENKLLARQIELLDRSHDYVPVDEEETEDDSEDDDD